MLVSVKQLFTTIVTLFSLSLVVPQIQAGQASVLQLDIPRIGAYKKNFRNDVTKVISEVHNSQITLPVLRYEDNTWEGQSIQLDCNASYPVQWTYTGLGAPVIHTTTFRRAENYFNASSYIYSASVIFAYTTEAQTGNYSCQSVQNADLHADFYVYVPGPKIFLADLEPNKRHVIIVKASEPWVTLPCAVSNKASVVRLFKLLPKGSRELAQSPDYLTYDPRLGFHFKWTSVADPLGDYFCAANRSTTRNGKFTKFHIRLELSKVEIISPFDSEYDNRSPEEWEIEDDVKGVLRFAYDEEHNRITCCTTSKEIPKLRGIGCRGVSDCNIRRKYLEAKKCPPSCEQHVVKISKTCAGYELSDSHDSGILECSVEGSTEYFEFSKDDEDMFTNFTSIPSTNQVLKLTVENSPKAGKIFISCYSNSFFFSTGHKWAWQRSPNSNLEFVPEDHFPSRNYLEVDKLNVTGSTVYCFAPIWSNSEWRNTSILIS